jgi:phytoene dehydrogenase-like protein
MLYLGVDKEYDLPHHQIYASSEYENNLKDITNHRLTWDDPSVYVQNASITDDSLAPDGHSTVFTYWYLYQTNTRASFGMTSKQTSEKLLSNNLQSLDTMT